MEATKQPPPDDEGPRSRPKHRGRRLMRTLRQYRIILSADTASEVRQLLSQKRR